MTDFRELQLRYWSEQFGETEVAIAGKERSLGLRLPEVLRDFYRMTTVRDENPYLAVFPLADLKVWKGRLELGGDQTTGGFAGLSVAACAEADPLIEEWDVRLSAFLETVLLAARPVASPHDSVPGLSEELLQRQGWVPSAAARDLELTLYTSEHGVTDLMEIGARDAGALQAAMASLETAVG